MLVIRRYTIRWCGEELMNLDSDLCKPERLKDDAACHKHVQRVLDGGGHAFIVRRARQTDPGLNVSL